MKALANLAFDLCHASEKLHLVPRFHEEARRLLVSKRFLRDR